MFVCLVSLTSTKGRVRQNYWTWWWDVLWVREEPVTFLMDPGFNVHCL